MLTTYITEARRLIRDRSGIMVPTVEMTDYVNEARRDVCRVTACIRCLIAGNAPFGSGATPGLMIPGAATPGSNDTSVTTFQTIPGVEKYHFGYATPYLRAQYAGVDRVLDLMTVAVSWGNAARPVMEWRSWEELQALGRIYSVGVFSYPFCAALQGDGANQQLYLFPPPDQALEMEWDASVLPAPLNTDSDPEAIPDPFRGAIKYKAAEYAYLGQQRYGGADLMAAQFADHLGLDRAASRRGEVPSYYDRM